MRMYFDYGRWFDHKGGQLHNNKKQNAISEKAWLDKSVKSGTNHPATNQSSMLPIVSCTNRSKYYSPANVASLHKEDIVEGGGEYKSQAESNYEISTSKSSKISCEGIFPEMMSKYSRKNWRSSINLPLYQRRVNIKWSFLVICHSFTHKSAMTMVC